MRALSIIPLLAGLAACVPMSDSNETMLTGTVTYRERIALPPDSRLIVTISDVSLMDAPSVTIAQNQITTAGQQVPISFAVSYDRARIQPGRSYAVSARILDKKGQLAWITDTRNPLPPPGQSIELWLVQARR
jgi:putative lipoprotein